MKKTKTVAQRNAEFQALPLNEQRVAIARDAIEQILTSRYVAKAGVYFRLDVKKYDVATKTTDLQTVLNERIQCDVCARGAIFASAVRLSDGVTISHSDISRSWEQARLNYARGDEAFYRKEHEAFHDRQLRLMECAFERAAHHRASTTYAERDPGHITSEEAYDAIYFCSDYESDEERLLAIMQNIVDHNGEFVPKDPVILPTHAKDKIPR